MTENQLKYWSLEEEKRKNREQENISRFSATETKRSNLAKELETNRSNVAKEKETNRSNLAKEKETERHNKNDEVIKGVGTAVSGITSLFKLI